MVDPEKILDLPKALEIIRTLESQLAEINTVSKEYETEMEVVLHHLQSEVANLEQKNKEHHIKERNLEIKLEELESENDFLSQKLNNVLQQNDKLMENNILLEHEVIDLRKYTDCISLKSVSSGKSSSSSLCSTESLTVSTKGSSLLIKPAGSKDNEISMPTLEISQLTIISSTATIPLST